MIKVDKDSNEFMVEGDVELIFSEIIDVLKYCAIYYVNSACNGGGSFDGAKDNMRDFLLDAVEYVMDGIVILPDSDTYYTS